MNDQPPRPAMRSSRSVAGAPRTLYQIGLQSRVWDKIASLALTIPRNKRRYLFDQYAIVLLPGDESLAVIGCGKRRVAGGSCRRIQFDDRSKCLSVIGRSSQIDSTDLSDDCVPGDRHTAIARDCNLRAIGSTGFRVKRDRRRKTFPAVFRDREERS